jgi:4-hydroxy-3-methylbut-2-enyl diphosphate reductase
MLPPPSSAPGATCTILAFNGRNQLAVPAVPGPAALAVAGPDPAAAAAALAALFPVHTPPAEYFTATTPGGPVRVFVTQVGAAAAPAGLRFSPLDQLAPDAALAAVLAGLEPYLAEIPYLELGESDFIYRFRPAAERNDAIYGQDKPAQELYQSRLCSAIKDLARVHERSAGAAVPLDFGAVHYVIPSHFGFCLGVKNAIERAYETLAEQPGRRVFMLSELIHNPFVNQDLYRRGLRYLQSDKGVPYPDGGPEARATSTLWDTLTPDDVVIIPAFGATDEDKARLVRKGLPLRQYDATCMLVEKVWRAARAYGREGYTIVVHGKHEHEETKATFSHTRRHAHAVIVRNLEEARELGALVGNPDAKAHAAFLAKYAGRVTPGFDPARHLERIAVVNQTTLLMNETLGIIEYFRGRYRERFGDAQRVAGSGSGRDTLCYATQVNQDALGRALEQPLDAALVVGGRNSSNTFQLYRLCAQKLGDRAHYITSEQDILADGRVRHYEYGSAGSTGATERPLYGNTPASSPRRILVTGGASCPDGIIQQVIDRLNTTFPPEKLRPIEAVLADLEAT